MNERKFLLFGVIISLCVVVGFATYINENKLTEKPNEDISKNSVLAEKGEIKISNQDEENITQNETAQINSQEDAKKATDIAQQSETSFSTEISNEDFISSDDKVVKSEISKYVDTKEDFRLNRQENIDKKVYSLTFFEVENIIENDEKVVYKNELEDIFKYDAKSGKLREAIINSVVTQKTNESIDENAAQKIAIEYAKTKYEIDAYKLYSCKETTKGHNYIYTRYIGGYPSTDKFSIKVGYDGNIVYISDFTDTFDGKELNYSKEFIDSKIKEYSNETEVNWDSIKICLDEEGEVAVSYTIPEQHTVAVLPLE